MIPLFTELQNIGPHDRTIIDWREVASPCALVAPYKTGKTFILEASIAALFGRFAWYGGEIYDHVSQGCAGDALIRFAFSAAGRNWLVERKINPRSRTQKPCLYDDSSFHSSNFSLLTSAKPIAGPTQKSFDLAVYNLVGDEKTFLAIPFLSQNRKGDLIGQPGDKELEKRRRECFFEMISAAEFDRVEERAGELQRETDAAAREIEAQLTADPDFDSAIADEQSTLETSTSSLSSLQTSLFTLQTSLDEVRRSLRDLAADDESLLLRIKTADDRATLQGRLAVQLRSLRSEIETLTANAAKLPQADLDIARLDQLARERDDLRAALENFKEFQTWHRDRDRLHLQASSLKSQADLLSSRPGLDPETIALAGRVDALREEYRKADADNAARKKLNSQRLLSRSSISSTMSTLQGRIEDLSRRIESKPVTPGPKEACDVCPLNLEFANLPALKARAEEDLRLLQIELEAVPQDEVIADLAPLVAQGRDAANAAKLVSDSALVQQQLTNTRAEMASVQSKIETHDSLCPDSSFILHPSSFPRDPSPDLARVQSEMDRLAGAAERVRSAEDATRILVTKSTDLSSAESDLRDLQAAIAFDSIAVITARNTLADRAAQRTKLTAEESSTASTLSTTSTELSALQKSIGASEARLAELQRRKSERSEKQSRLASLRDRFEALKDLRLCFGPRGFRNLIIDQEALRLGPIADQLFQIATDGRWRLRIATQEENQDGSTRETFKILISDERGERDALAHSGGEVQFIRIIFRIAVSIWLGDVRGARPECLIFDEAFDNLGIEGTEELLRVIEYLKDQITHLCVVTHDPAIAARFPGVVRLSSRFGGVTVSINDQMREVA